MEEALLFTVIFVAVSLLALLVRVVLRVPPRLIPGNLEVTHVPTPLALDEALKAVAPLELFVVARQDEKRGVIVLDARPARIAEQFAGGKKLRTFGYWVFLVFRPLPEEAGTDVAVGVQRKWLEFGEGSKILRKAVRDATVRELWTKLPPPPRSHRLERV